MERVPVRRLMLFILLTLGLMAPSAWSATPVGQYLFDEGCGQATDSSGRGNHGTIVGCTYARQTQDSEFGELPPAPIGAFALLFDADVDLVRVPTSGWSAASGTLALWVKLSSCPSGDHYFFGHTTSPIFSNRIQLYTNTSDCGLDIGLGNSHTVAANVSTIPPDTWTHVALHWQEGTAGSGAGNYVVYVNGASVRNGTYAGLTQIAASAHLGNNGDHANSIAGMRGLLDAVHIYSSVLTLQEIQALAAVTTGGPTAFEGYAATATGGQAFIDTPTIVNNCFADNPPATPRVGSLRWAVQQGSRYIKIAVGCPTPVNFGSNFVYVRSDTTIDAMNAPAPGYQYIGSITVDGSRCSPRCNNIIVQGLIYRGDGTTASCSGVAMRVERGGHLVVFDRNTIFKSSNDSIGITANEGSPTTYVDTRDITISRNAIISPQRPGNPSIAGSGCPSDSQSEYGAKTAMIMDNRVRHITVIRNFFKDVTRRVPWIAYDDSASPPDTMLDMRNNLLFDVGGESSRDGGAFMRDHVRANWVNNYVNMRSGLSSSAQRRYMIVCAGANTEAEDSGACSGESVVDAVYATGTVHAQNQANDAAKGTTGTALSAAATTTTDACTAAQQILTTAGAPQRSAEDIAAFNSVTLTGCAVTPPPPTINTFAANPAAITSGNSATLSWDVAGAVNGCSINQGIGQVCASASACDAGGTRIVFPTATTTYTLTCANGSSQATAPATVTVNPVGPTITVFSATPATIQLGESAVLSWDAANASGGCSINQGIGSVCASASECDAGGTTPVFPAATTIYTLTCSNPSGNPTAQATVTVAAPPAPSTRRQAWIGD